MWQWQWQLLCVLIVYSASKCIPLRLNTGYVGAHDIDSKCWTFNTESGNYINVSFISTTNNVSTRLYLFHKYYDTVIYIKSYNGNFNETIQCKRYTNYLLTLDTYKVGTDYNYKILIHYPIGIFDNNSIYMFAILASVIIFGIIELCTHYYIQDY